MGAIFYCKKFARKSVNFNRNILKISIEVSKYDFVFSLLHGISGKYIQNLIAIKLIKIQFVYYKTSLGKKS